MDYPNWSSDVLMVFPGILFYAYLLCIQKAECEMIYHLLYDFQQFSRVSCKKQNHEQKSGDAGRFKQLLQNTLHKPVCVGNARMHATTDCSDRKCSNSALCGKLLSCKVLCVLWVFMSWMTQSRVDGGSCRHLNLRNQLVLKILLISPHCKLSTINKI